MHTKEAERFLEAFSHKDVRELVKEMMLQHYAEAVTEHHPGQVDRNLVYRKTRFLRDEIFARMNRIKEPKAVDPLLKELSRKNPNPHPIWFEEFNRAYEHYKHNRKLPLKVSRIEPFFTGDSICDVGCGGGDLLNYIRLTNRRFREFAGIDIMDWRTETIKESINFQMLDLSLTGAGSHTQYDTLTCIAVLHHVGRTDEDIHTFLQNLQTALRPQGRLIIEEDVMLPPAELGKNPHLLKQARQIEKEQALFGEFLELETDAQKNVMILVDVLANAFSGGITEMAFPFGFRTVEQWNKLFIHNGFHVEDVFITGFQKGLFNRSSHVYFILAHSP
jgi:2-polyprenyl-3-methyl-5-hydroxy-6-metoxy-1,4-benzoquinol methylase